MLVQNIFEIIFDWGCFLEKLSYFDFIVKSQVAIGLIILKMCFLFELSEIYLHLQTIWYNLSDYIKNILLFIL